MLSSWKVNIDVNPIAVLGVVNTFGHGPVSCCSTFTFQQNIYENWRSSSWIQSNYKFNYNVPIYKKVIPLWISFTVHTFLRQTLAYFWDKLYRTLRQTLEYIMCTHFKTRWQIRVQFSFSIKPYTFLDYESEFYPEMSRIRKC